MDENSAITPSPVFTREELLDMAWETLKMENKLLSELLENSVKKLEVATKALEFYADKENWTIEEDYGGYLIDGIIKDDVYLDDKENHPHWGRGGKRAREALKRLEK